MYFCTFCSDLIRNLGLLISLIDETRFPILPELRSYRVKSLEVYVCPRFFWIGKIEQVL